jgi:aspartate/methionine/tyrosine aminotransferase
MLNVSQFEIPGAVFSRRLLDEAHVATVPAGFGEVADHHVRLTYTASESELGRGVYGIRRFIAGLQ